MNRNLMHFCRSPLCLAGRRNWTFHTHVRLEQWCTNCFSVVLDLMTRQLIRLSSQHPAELLGWLNAVMNGLLFIISVSINRWRKFPEQDSKSDTPLSGCRGYMLWVWAMNKHDQIVTIMWQSIGKILNQAWQTNLTRSLEWNGMKDIEGLGACVFCLVLGLSESGEDFRHVLTKANLVCDISWAWQVDKVQCMKLCC